MSVGRRALLGPSPAFAGETFFRAPQASVGELEPGQVAVLGVPHELTKISRTGQAEAPAALREATLMFEYAVNALSDREIVDIDRGTVYRFAPERFVDLGDLALSEDDVAANVETISDVLARVAAAGATPLVFGGDHFVTYPVVRGVARGRRSPFAYLHVDMHLDLADEAVGFGRYASGTPVRRLLEDGSIDAARTVIYGLDPLQPCGEWEFASEHDIACVSSTRMRAEGVERTLVPLLEEALDGADGLYVSFDIDALARVYAPGTGNTVGATGLTPAEALEIAAVLDRVPLVGLDLVEVAPRWDESGATAGLGIAIVTQILWRLLFEETR